MEGQALKTPDAIPPRLPAEVLRGSAPDAVREIEGDFALLASVLEASASRVWTCTETAVVLGVSRDPGEDADLECCERRGAALLRRASGGGTVVIGPGTVQYAIAISHRSGDVPGIDAVKQACNRVVIGALRESGIARSLDSEPSGDLRAGSRKFGGVALRRRRDATLLHGTLLVEADLAAIAELLRHPAREPAWRQGRSHLDFLANVGVFDRTLFARALDEAVTRMTFEA